MDRSSTDMDSTDGTDLPPPGDTYPDEKTTDFSFIDVSHWNGKGDILLLLTRLFLALAIAKYYFPQTALSLPLPFLYHIEFSQLTSRLKSLSEAAEYFEFL